uniref:RlsB n=1 Tax=Volvox ferrisii TaxID=1075618 RepID=A0A075M2C9_9CHLO|nr:RlsB [Volvox ferrisii]
MEAALPVEERDNIPQGQENQQSPPSLLATESPMEVVAPASRRASLDHPPAIMPMAPRTGNPPRGHPGSPSQQPRGPAIALRPLRPTLANTSAVGALLSPSQLLRLAQSPQTGAQHPGLRYVLDPETGSQLYAPQGSHLDINADDSSDRPSPAGAQQPLLVLRAVKYLQERSDNQQTATAVQPQPALQQQQQQQPPPPPQQQQQQQPQQQQQQQQQAAVPQNGHRDRQSSDVTGSAQHAPSGSASGGQETTTYGLARMLQQEQQQQQHQQQRQQQQQWQLAQEQQRSISLQKQQQSQQQQSGQTGAAESLARPTAGGTTATGTSGEAAETQEPIDDDEVAGAPAAPGSDAALGEPPSPVEVTVAVRVGAGGGRRPRGGVNRLATDIVRNGYTRGPVSGVFDLNRYKTGRDCIFYGNRWMSRSHFEKVGGSKMAKWYRSIRVLPELEMLGDWLERHGLTVTRGPSRRSSKRPAESDERVLGPSIEQVDSADVEGSSAGGEATTAGLPLAQQLLLQRQGSIPSSERRFLQRLLNTLPLQMSPHGQTQHLDAMSGDAGEGSGRMPRDLYGPQSRLAWAAHPLAGAGYPHDAPRLPDAESARGDDASPDSGGAEMLSPRWRQQPPARRQCIRDLRDMPMTPPVQLPLQWATATAMEQGAGMPRHRSGQLPGRQQDLDDAHDVDAGEELDLSAPRHHAAAGAQPLPALHGLQSLPPPPPRLRRVPYPGLDPDGASQGLGTTLGTTSSSRTTTYPMSDGQPPVLVLRRPNAMAGSSPDERGGDGRQNGMDGYGPGSASVGAVNGDEMRGSRWQSQSRKRQYCAVDESEWPEEPRRQPMYDQPRQVAVPVQMRRFMQQDDPRRGGEATDEYPPRLMLVRRPAPLQAPSQQQQSPGWDTEEVQNDEGWGVERPMPGSSRGPKAARLSGPHAAGSPASQMPSWYAYGSAGSRDVGSRRWPERAAADVQNETRGDHHE